VNKRYVFAVKRFLGNDFTQVGEIKPNNSGVYNRINPEAYSMVEGNTLLVIQASALVE